MWNRGFSVLMLALGLGACVTYREDLNRGQRFYEENRYENALAIWRLLEHDTDSLSMNDQARYAYLRGMTDFRLGFRADSRHWLSIAKATDQEHPGGLNLEWKQRLEDSLTELNQEVYGGAEHFDKTDAPPSTSASTTPANAPGQSGGSAVTANCSSNSDCPAGQMCDGQRCTPY
jgi:hypothetical protein